MALAYAVVLVHTDLFASSRSQSIEVAQEQADEKFRKLAEESRKTLVTRTSPEPHIMSREEIRNHYPQVTGDFLDHIVGLFFTAEIS
jgi:hypothetical protein